MWRGIALVGESWRPRRPVQPPRRSRSRSWNSSDEEITTGDLDRRGEHGFFVEPTIPLGGKLRLSREVFQKTDERAEAIRDLQRLRIVSTVRQAFYAVLWTERRIEVQEPLAALASEAVGVTAQVFNVGAADRPDYLEIEDGREDGSTRRRVEASSIIG